MPPVHSSDGKLFVKTRILNSTTERTPAKRVNPTVKGTGAAVWWGARSNDEYLVCLLDWLLGFHPKSTSKSTCACEICKACTPFGARCLPCSWAGIFWKSKLLVQFNKVFNSTKKLKSWSFLCLGLTHSLWLKHFAGPFCSESQNTTYWLVIDREQYPSKRKTSQKGIFEIYLVLPRLSKNLSARLSAFWTNWNIHQRFQQIEISAKLLDYFLWRSKSNIIQNSSY